MESKIVDRGAVLPGLHPAPARQPRRDSHLYDAAGVGADRRRKMGRGHRGAGQAVAIGRRRDTEPGPLNQWIHIWAYKDAAERFRIREELRKDENGRPPPAACSSSRRTCWWSRPRSRRCASRSSRLAAGPVLAGVGLWGAGAIGGGRNRSRRRLNKPPADWAACAATCCGAGAASGSGRIGMPRVAASMKRRQACAGSEPPVTLRIGWSSSLPNQTPATRSAV